MKTIPRIVAPTVAILTLLATPAAHAQSFLRGDANGDEAIDITDSIFSLDVLFLGTALFACKDAADLDDDGQINITDPLYGINWLFLGGPDPRAPWPECGPDATADALDCESPHCAPNVECLDATLLEGLVGEFPALTVCLPAGLISLPLDGLAIDVCPEDEAPPECGLTGAAGCPIEIVGVAAILDVAGSRAILRIEGRIEDLPVEVTESLFGTTSVCGTSVHSTSDEDLPFAIDLVIPLITEVVSPGVREIVATGETELDGSDIAISASGGLVCRLFAAADDLVVPLLLAPLEAIIGDLPAELGQAVVGLRLCDAGE